MFFFAGLTNQPVARLCRTRGFPILYDPHHVGQRPKGIERPLQAARRGSWSPELADGGQLLFLLFVAIAYHTVLKAVLVGRTVSLGRKSKSPCDLSELTYGRPALPTGRPFLLGVLSPPPPPDRASGEDYRDSDCQGGEQRQFHPGRYQRILGRSQPPER
jgi:hypothetical protein